MAEDGRRCLGARAPPDLSHKRWYTGVKASLSVITMHALQYP